MYRIINKDTKQNAILLEKEWSTMLPLTKVIEITNTEINGGVEMLHWGQSYCGAKKFMLEPRKIGKNCVRDNIYQEILNCSVEIEPVEVYAVTGDTYSIKDQLKEDGAIWEPRQKVWYFMQANDKYKTEKRLVVEI